MNLLGIIFSSLDESLKIDFLLPFLAEIFKVLESTPVFPHPKSSEKEAGAGGGYAYGFIKKLERIRLFHYAKPLFSWVHPKLAYPLVNLKDPPENAEDEAATEEEKELGLLLKHLEGKQEESDDDDDGEEGIYLAGKRNRSNLQEKAVVEQRGNKVGEKGEEALE